MPDVKREAPNKTHVQSILLPTDKFDVPEAKAWLKAHGFFTNGIDAKTDYIHARQYNPDHNKFDYRTQVTDVKKGISFIYGFPKGQK